MNSFGEKLLKRMDSVDLVNCDNGPDYVCYAFLGKDNNVWEMTVDQFGIEDENWYAQTDRFYNIPASRSRIASYWHRKGCEIVFRKYNDHCNEVDRYIVL